MQVIILLRRSHLVVQQLLLVHKQGVLYLGALQLECLAHPKLLHSLQQMLLVAQRLLLEHLVPLLLERLVPLLLVLRRHQHLVVSFYFYFLFHRLSIPGL